MSVVMSYMHDNDGKVFYVHIESEAGEQLIGFLNYETLTVPGGFIPYMPHMKGIKWLTIEEMTTFIEEHGGVIHTRLPKYLRFLFDDKFAIIEFQIAPSQVSQDFEKGICHNIIQALRKRVWPSTPSFLS